MVLTTPSPSASASGPGQVPWPWMWMCWACGNGPSMNVSAAPLTFIVTVASVPWTSTMTSPVVPELFRVLSAAWADHMSESWAAAGAAAMVSAPRARVGTVRSMDLRIRFSPVSYRGVVPGAHFRCAHGEFGAGTGPDGCGGRKVSGAPERTADPSGAGPATNNGHGDDECVDGITSTRCGKVQCDTAPARTPGGAPLSE